MAVSIMEISNLVKLDNYGHKDLTELTKDQLSEYIFLLKERREQAIIQFLKKRR